MRIRNPALLRAIFACKGHFRPAIKPAERIFNGIAIAPFKNNARAAVTISADFELAWAFRHRGDEFCFAKARQCRENFDHLLSIFNDRDIPITWATVGHLFLESCARGSGGLAHPDMPRPPRNSFWAGDWYMHDPCTNYERDPFWYAPELIERMLASRVRHEIGSHSFSHIDFSPQCSDTTLVRREIEASASAMRRFGLAPRSLVYPFNRMGHRYLDALAESSITAVRHRDRRRRLSYPERTASGVYKIYESMNLRIARHYEYLDKVKIFLDEAMTRQAVFHLWFHPSDPAPVIQGELPKIVRYIGSQRDEGSIWVSTMSELVAYCEARERLTPQIVEETSRDMRIAWRGFFPSDLYGHTELSLILPPSFLPRTVTLTTEQGSRPLPVAHSVPRMAGGSTVLNMPTSAKSLHVAF